MSVEQPSNKTEALVIKQGLEELKAYVAKDGKGAEQFVASTLGLTKMLLDVNMGGLATVLFQIQLAFLNKDKYKGKTATLLQQLGVEVKDNVEGGDSESSLSRIYEVNGEVLKPTKAAQLLLQEAKDNLKQYGSTVNWCFKGVWRSLNESIGGEGITGRHAYMAIPALQKQKDKFQELPITRGDIRTLPAGTVVVWEKGTSKSGHITVIDGKGGEISDHYRRLAYVLPKWGKPHAFMPLDKGSIA